MQYFYYCYKYESNYSFLLDKLPSKTSKESFSVSEIPVRISGKAMVPKFLMKQVYV